ncbi:MAG: polysaccharide deacetylase family protein [Nitrosomonadales bacterium]|nr:polysaccharide deacetylase family protein [Nitrosomonadales bacterium]
MSFKKEIRNGIARMLSITGITNPVRRGRGRLSIATFHRVLPEVHRQTYPFPGLAVTPEELDTYLDYLSRHFDCGTLATQHERHLGGEMPKRPLLAITFDDAQHDNYAYACPVLAQHRIKASFFVPVAAVERQELLWHDRLGFAMLALLKQDEGDREQLAEILAAAGMPTSDPYNLVSSVVQASKKLTLNARLALVKKMSAAAGAIPAPEYARLMTFGELAGLAAEGHEIGSHSMTHCMMPECDDNSLVYEIAASRRLLQDRLGLPIESFCYPNGNSDARTAQAVAAAGYRRGVTTTWGSNGKEADRFRLRRFDMVSKHVQDADGNFLPALLDFRMSGFYPGLSS